MIKLFKRLFAWLFLGKKNTQQTESLNKKDVPLLRGQGEENEEIRAAGERPQEKIKERMRDSFMEPQRERKWRMRNNRIHIMYNGSGVLGSNFSCNRDKITNMILSFEKQDKRYNGAIESMRCTKLERAQEIIGSISRDIIKKAMFQDKTGEQFKIA